MPDQSYVQVATEALYHAYYYRGWREYDAAEARALWERTFSEGSQAGSEWGGTASTFLRALPGVLRVATPPASADTRTLAIEAAETVIASPEGGRATIEGLAALVVDALVAAGLIRPAHDDAAIERAARAMYHADRERRGIDPDYTKMARAALAAADQEDTDG